METSKLKTLTSFHDSYMAEVLPIRSNHQFINQLFKQVGILIVSNMRLLYIEPTGRGLGP